VTTTETPPREGWHRDPTGRHSLRYWNGRSWTADVVDNGRQGVDPLEAPAPPDGAVPPTVPVAPPLPQLPDPTSRHGFPAGTRALIGAAMVVVVLAVGVAAFVALKPGTSDDQVLADAALLDLTDLPVGWTVSSSSGSQAAAAEGIQVDQEIDDCVGRGATQRLDGAQRAYAQSALLNGPAGSTALSQAYVFGSSADVGEFLAAFERCGVDQIADGLLAGLAIGAGNDPSISFDPGTPTPFTTPSGASGWRTEVVVRGPGGQVTVVSDLLFQHHDRVVTTIMLAGLNGEALSAVDRELVLSRIAARVNN
jgi:hypothetical protein